MISASLGDLAHSYSLQRRNTSLQQELQKLSLEISSGQVADVRSVLDGNYSYLGELERSLETLEGYEVATAEAGLYANSMQIALDRVYEMNERLSTDLIFAGNSPLGVASGNPTVESRETARALIDVLNTSNAGRSLFGGIATDTPPMASLDDLVDGVRTALAGATSPADMIAAAETWLADPGGFTATMYQGADTSLAAFQLTEHDSVPLNVRGDDQAFGKLLVFSAVSSLATDATFGLTALDQTELHGAIGETLLGTQSEVIELRSLVGFAEGRIDEITTRNSAERISMTFARQDLLAADPFETATRLEEVQFQLQSLYAVTAKSAQLSLVNYL